MRASAAAARWDARRKFDKIFQISSRVQLQKNLILKVKFPAQLPRPVSAARSQLPTAAPCRRPGAAPSQLPNAAPHPPTPAARGRGKANVCSERMFGVRDV